MWLNEQFGAQTWPKFYNETKQIKTVPSNDPTRDTKPSLLCESQDFESFHHDLDHQMLTFWLLYIASYLQPI